MSIADLVPESGNAPAGLDTWLNAISEETDLLSSPNRPQSTLGNLGAAHTILVADGPYQKGTVDNAALTITVPAAPTGAAAITMELTNSVGSVAITMAGAAWLGWLQNEAPSFHAGSGDTNLLDPGGQAEPGRRGLCDGAGMDRRL